MQKITKKTLRFFYDLSPQRFFLVIGLCFGLLFLIIIPPFQVPDELAHLSKSYQVSRFNFMQDNLGNTSGGKIPKSIIEYYRIANEGEITTNLGSRYNYKLKAEQLWKVHIQSGETTEVEYPNFGSYPPLPYLPQALGIIIGQLFSDRVSVIFFLGRLLNLAIYLILGYLAVRTIDRAKWPMAIFALMPMGLFVAASFSADSLTLGVVLLLVAIISKMYGMKTIPVKWWVFLGVVSTATALVKPVYILLTLLTAILLIRQRGSVFYAKGEFLERLKAVCAVLSTAWAAYFLWAYFNRGVSVDVSSMQSAAGLVVDPSRNINFILHQPWEYLSVIFNTLFGHFSDGYTMSMFGVFGWFNVPIPQWAIYLLVIVLVLSLGLPEDSIKRFRRLTFVYVSLVSLACLLGIVSALFIYWTSFHAAAVNGLQGRYFLPLLISLVPALAGQYKHNIKVIYLKYCLIVVLGVSILSLYARY